MKYQIRVSFLAHGPLPNFERISRYPVAHARQGLIDIRKICCTFQFDQTKKDIKLYELTVVLRYKEEHVHGVLNPKAGWGLYMCKRTFKNGRTPANIATGWRTIAIISSFFAMFVFTAFFHPYPPINILENI